MYSGSVIFSCNTSQIVCAETVNIINDKDKHDTNFFIILPQKILLKNALYF